MGMHIPLTRWTIGSRTAETGGVAVIEPPTAPIVEVQPTPPTFAPEQILQRVVRLKHVTSEFYGAQEGKKLSELQLWKDQRGDQHFIALQHNETDGSYDAVIFTDMEHTIPLHLGIDQDDIARAMRKARINTLNTSSYDTHLEEVCRQLPAGVDQQDWLGNQWRNKSYDAYNEATVVSVENVEHGKIQLVDIDGPWTMQAGKAQVKEGYYTPTNKDMIVFSQGDFHQYIELKLNNYGDTVTKQGLTEEDYRTFKESRDTTESYAPLAVGGSVLQGIDGYFEVYNTNENLRSRFRGEGAIPLPIQEDAEAAQQKILFSRDGHLYEITVGLGRDQEPVESTLPFTDVVRMQFDSNKNFLFVQQADNTLSIYEPTHGVVVEQITDVPSEQQVLITDRGDIAFLDTDGHFQKYHTNLGNVPQRTMEVAYPVAEQELLTEANRIANVTLPEVRGKQSSFDLSDALRNRVLSLIVDPLESNNIDAMQRATEQIRVLQRDPDNQQYIQGLQEVINRVEERVTRLRTDALAIGLQEFKIPSLASVDDIFRAEEKLSGFEATRKQLAITDLTVRGQIETQLQTMRQKVDDLINASQNKIERKIVNKLLPKLQRHLNRVGSLGEMEAVRQGSLEQEFWYAMRFIRNPQVAEALTERYLQRVQGKSQRLTEGEQRLYQGILLSIRANASLLRQQLRSQLAGEVDQQKIEDALANNKLLTFVNERVQALPEDLRTVMQAEVDGALAEYRVGYQQLEGVKIENGRVYIGDASFPIAQRTTPVLQAEYVRDPGKRLSRLAFRDLMTGRVYQTEERVLSRRFPRKRTMERAKKEVENMLLEATKAIPRIQTQWRLNDYNRERLAEMMELFATQREGNNGRGEGITILQGEAGTGKDVTLEIFAALTGMRLVEIPCKNHTTAEDFDYSLAFSPAKGTYYIPSQFIKEIQIPNTIIVFNEINSVDAGELKSLDPSFDYKRRYESAKTGKVIPIEETNLIAGTMNRINFLGTKPLAAEVLSRADIMDFDYPPYAEQDGNTQVVTYKSDEAEVIAAYIPTLAKVPQKQFRQIWNHLINHQDDVAAESYVEDNPQVANMTKALYDVLRVATALRTMYIAFHTGMSTEALDSSPLSMREMVKILPRLKGLTGDPKEDTNILFAFLKRSILPKISDSDQRERVSTTIEAELFPSNP